MVWTFHKVVFKLQSPMHIGWRKLGNLQQTRPYVTGRVLWGALTYQLVKAKSGNDFEAMKTKVDKELRFTYFYPSDSEKEVGIWPWEKRDKFSWLFLDSYASTALKMNVADQGTLHETEYIAPKTREGEQVYLIGYIIEKETCDLNWRDVLDKIQLGGERNYGWGRVSLTDIVISEDCFGKKIDDSNINPVITIEKEGNLLAHTKANDLNCNGTIEPFIGRETININKYGFEVSKADICWTPGSKLCERKGFEILKQGVWNPI